MSLKRTEYAERCSKCGWENTNHRNYCNQCGNTLSWEIEARECPKCHNDYWPGEDKYCNCCGVCLADAEREAQLHELRKWRIEEEVRKKRAVAAREAEQAEEKRRAVSGTLILKVIGADKFLSLPDGTEYTFYINGSKGQSYYENLYLHGDLTTKTVKYIDPDEYTVKLVVSNCFEDSDGEKHFSPIDTTSCSVRIGSRETWTLESKRAAILGHAKITVKKN